MAAKLFYRKGFLLLLFNFISTAALEKRFSDFKRCADEECSMLLCRGKAVSNFSGPDCRFLEFKKSETVYVYYKLSGRRTDIWAGSVGSHFGYFPKDTLAVNHVYTDKELEVPAEETDFVCFDTGFDKFDSYDIDSLLGSAVVTEENVSENTGTTDQIQKAEGIPKETTSGDEATESQTEIDPNDKSEDLDKVSDDESAALPTLDLAESLTPKAADSDTGAATDATETGEIVLENIDLESTEISDTFIKPEVEVVSKGDSVLENYPVSDSTGMQIPVVETTFGSTFDAVTTDDETTAKITPYEEEESIELESWHDDHSDEPIGTPLLSFSDKASSTPASDSLKKVESLTTTHDDKPLMSEDKNMQTPLLGYTDVSAGKETHDSSLEEEKDVKDEDAASKGPQTSEEAKKKIQSLDADVSGGKETHDSSLEEEKEDKDEDVASESPQTSEEAKKEIQSLDTDVSGGKETHDSSLEEEKDDKDEDIAPESPQTSEEAKKEIQSLSKESSKEPENIGGGLNDSSTSSSVQAGTKDTDSASEKLLFEDGKSDEEVIGQEGVQDELLGHTDEQIYHETEMNTSSVNPVSQSDSSVRHQAQTSDIILTDEPTEVEEQVPKESEANSDDALIEDSNIILEHREVLDNILEVNKTITDEELPVNKTEPKQDLSIERKPSDNSDFKGRNEETSDDNLLNRHNHLTNQPELFVEETKVTEKQLMKEIAKVPLEDPEPEEEEKEELLEDENAISFSQPHTDSDKPSPESSRATVSTSEPEYSDSVLRLTLLRDHFAEERMERLLHFFGLKNLFKVEAMFSDLETELQASRLSHASTTQDIEKTLENILEASENFILDEIEKMLDSREAKHSESQVDSSMLDEETEVLDEFQELAFSLRQKYSAAHDSAPLATDRPLNIDQEPEPKLNVEEDAFEENLYNLSETKNDDNIKATNLDERPAENEKEQIALDEVHSGPDISVDEDGGHFNKNKDSHPTLSASDGMQKVPQANLENSFDMGLSVEVERSPSGSLDSMEPGADFHEEDVGLFSTGIVYTTCIFAMIKTKVAEWTDVVISLLPEQWKPGETMFGCPWQAVVITALVGVVTFTLFFWRTILAVKKRQYLMDEKRFNEQIQALKKEKTNALSKMSELQKLSQELEEKQKQSQEKTTCTMRRIQDLESKVLEAQTQNEQIFEEKNMYAKLLEEERANSLKIESRIEKLEKSNEKLQLSRKKTQDALSKTTVLLDEAKIREDARNVQHKCLERDYTTLKEENKTLKATIKDWEDKHKDLSGQLKVHQKSLKELEDSVVLKDHNVEVLSELLADLDACDLQKGDNKAFANGEVAPDKKAVVKNRIQQMLDVSRVQTTLTVVEEERDRFMSKLLNEEKARKALEEQHQELEHAIATLKRDRSHIENQFKILQQKNEIMVEMYQQKEHALQQRLTKEELERRSKENLLSEVGGKAVEAEEQVKVLRQRIGEMEEQMKKTEEVYKEQIKEQENKTHSNWVTARNAERALNQEKLETSKLREKLAVLTSQLNERRAPLFRPSSGQPAGPRQGDSHGPSPVSGGAPSPPLMMEGPRRPPSAPVGRRIDPYGPRPPSDPHGRYPENKHTSGIDMMGPRNSSPANVDGSTEPQTKADAKAEASTESPEPGPGSFLASPIRDSPGPTGGLPPLGSHRPARPMQGPLGPMYHPPIGMAGPHGLPAPNVPPLGLPLPANGHPGMPLPGPMGGDFGLRPANGHAFRPRAGPDPRGPPPPHFRPPPPHHFGPMPPPHSLRGPIGPRPPFPPDMRFPGPRDRAYPPVDLPPGVAPHLGYGDSFVPSPHDALQNSVGPHTGPRQDPPMKQETPQDSARPAMAEP